VQTSTTSTTYITLSYSNGRVSVSLSFCLSQSCAPSTTGTSYITRSYNNVWVSVSLSLSVLQLCTLPSVLNLPPLVRRCSRPPIRPPPHALIITVGCLSVCLSVFPTSHCLVITVGCPSVSSTVCPTAVQPSTANTSSITRTYNNGWVSVSLSVCLSQSCADVHY